MSDTVPTPPEREGEERWTLYVCENAHCNRAMSTKPVPPVSGSFTTCIECERPQLMRPVEVVPLACLTELERERDQAWAEAEEYSQDAHHWQAAYRSVVARAEAVERALREVEELLEAGATATKDHVLMRQTIHAALKRARTTTTEEVPHA